MIAISAILCYDVIMKVYHSPFCMYSHSSKAVPVYEDYFGHIHDRYELLFFVEGDADYIIENEYIQLQPRTLVFIRAGEYHYLKLKSQARYESYTCHFNVSMLSFPLGDLKVLPRFVRVEKNSPIDKLYSVLRMAEYDYKYGDEEFKALIKNTMECILLQMKYSSSDERKNEAHALLSQIVEYINTHLQEKITAEILSRHFFCSVSWLQHIFPSHFGITLKQFIDEKKMIYAQHLMESGMKITKVAEECGYDNYSTFYRVYKRYSKPNA